MGGLGLLTSLGSGWVEVEPVGANLESEVEQHKAHDEDFPRSPGLIAEDGVLTEPFLCNLLLLIHVLSKLEIEESDLISGEVTCQFNVDSAATIGD